MTALVFWDTWLKVGEENRDSANTIILSKLHSVKVAKSGFKPGCTESCDFSLEAWSVAFLLLDDSDIYQMVAGMFWN